MAGSRFASIQAGGFEIVEGRVALSKGRNKKLNGKEKIKLRRIAINAGRCVDQVSRVCAAKAVAKGVR